MTASTSCWQRYDDFFTEDLEWHSPVARMTGRSYVGRAGLAAHLADLRESFTDIKADPTKIARDRARRRPQLTC